MDEQPQQPPSPRDDEDVNNRDREGAGRLRHQDQEGAEVLVLEEDADADTVPPAHDDVDERVNDAAALAADESGDMGGGFVRDNDAILAEEDDGGGDDDEDEFGVFGMGMLDGRGGRRGVGGGGEIDDPNDSDMELEGNDELPPVGEEETIVIRPPTIFTFEDVNDVEYVVRWLLLLVEFGEVYGVPPPPAPGSVGALVSLAAHPPQPAVAEADYGHIIDDDIGVIEEPPPPPAAAVMDSAGWFRQLVAMLREPEGPGQILGQIAFQRFDFDQDDKYRPSDVEALFGDVLVTHRFLRLVKFTNCTIPAQFLEPLTLSIRTPSPLLASMMRGVRTLELVSCNIDSLGISHLAAWIGGGNCPLRYLRIEPDKNRGGLDPDDCRILCDAVCGNTYLVSLALRVQQVLEGTLGRVASSPESPLRQLHLTAKLTHPGVAALAQQLRTNVRMRYLIVEPRGARNDDLDFDFCYRQLQETVNTYNFTLRTLSVKVSRNAYFLLEDNRRIRTLVRRLRPKKYRVDPTSLWPVAFERVRAFPTLLYRLLRRGNVDELCDVVRRSASNEEEAGNNPLMTTVCAGGTTRSKISW